MNTASTQNEERRSRSRPPKITTTGSFDYEIGICLLLVVALLWTSSNFAIQYTFTGGYQKPFMVTYLSTAPFTLYLLPSCIRKLSAYNTLNQRRNISHQPLSQDTAVERDPLISRLSCEVDDHITPEETAKLAIYFGIMWFAANWALGIALACTSVASATVLSSMSGIFTLAIGRIFHVETLSLMKICAVFTSFGGVALVSLSDSSPSPTPTLITHTQSGNFVATLGDIFALLSALFYAMYMVYLKVQIKDESRIDMQLLFGYMGVFIISLGWPVALLLHWLGLESLELPSTKEGVVAILVNMFVTLLADYLYVTAMLKTTPLVVTVGLSLTIPLALFGDYFLGKPATFQVLVGAMLVTGGFIVVGVENSQPGGIPLGSSIS
ncbi:hypothetical protein JVU11DRAFT_5261 [Chiua virens]|nr:hypothetical protein JVU11DRAFT_5261 [Chiua virens]